jgi:hypothetical protein
MLAKYYYVSRDQYYDDITIYGLALEPLLKNYIESNIDTLPHNIHIYSNCKEVINSHDHINTRLAIEFISHYNDLIPSTTKYYIYKSIQSFDQNNILLASRIRNHIINTFTTNITKLHDTNKYNIINVGIGGEYYLYHYILSFINKYDKYIGFTNNKYIHTDAEYNYSRLNKHNTPSTCKQINVVNYLLESYCDLQINKNQNTSGLSINIQEIVNKLIGSQNKIDIIINLAQLHIDVIKFISLISDYINTLIIISCKKMDFEKKVKYLPDTIKQHITSTVFTDDTLKQTITVYTYYKS